MMTIQFFACILWNFSIILFRENYFGVLDKGKNVEFEDKLC